MTTIKIGICLLCITFLFSETAFGICIGCILYQKIRKKNPLYCPGNVCEVKRKEKIQQFSKLQMMSLILFFTGLYFLSDTLTKNQHSVNMSINTEKLKCGAGKCGTAM
jgi:hypothetical protein